MPPKKPTSKKPTRTRKKKEPTPSSDARGSLSVYLAEINKYPLLTVEEEQRHARRFRDKGDLDAAHLLVMSNLRFVVKVAYEYRSYGIKMADLIQEGNIGLMKAVQKFEPDRQIRLISYAVWWIRAYIQNYILKSWSLVKLGTTQAQRKLFFSLARTRRELEKFGEPPTDEDVAKKAGVKPDEVREMRGRMEGRDLSLDAPVSDTESTTHVDFLQSLGRTNAQELLEDATYGRLVREKVAVALTRLDARERYIIEQRVMVDKPRTLKEIGEHFGFSRERARQLEIRAKEKLKAELIPLLELEEPPDDEP